MWILTSGAAASLCYIEVGVVWGCINIAPSYQKGFNEIYFAADSNFFWIYVMYALGRGSSEYLLAWLYCQVLSVVLVSRPTLYCWLSQRGAPIGDCDSTAGVGLCRFR